MVDGSTPQPGETDLAELFQRHRAGLAGAVRSILGTDGIAAADVASIVQDAFVRALTAHRRGAHPDDPEAWIFVLTMNLAKDRRRSAVRKTPTQTLEENAMQVHATGSSPGERAVEREAIGAARAAIARLADTEKEVFLLRVSGELTFEATAAALGIPVGTAKTRMRAALARLRDELAGFGPDTSVRTGSVGTQRRT